MIRSRMMTGSALAATALATAASADVIGWTANVRAVATGGFFVDVFLVANQGDGLLNVYGGYPNAPDIGWVSTTASGGFRQSNEEPLRAWRPGQNQGWNSQDSFLTIGGGLNSQGVWTGNASTAGDPLWNVGGIDTFSTSGGPNANNVPFTAGWYIAGSSSPARSLANLTNRVASSSAAAAAGTFGMLVAHLFISDTAPSVVLWNMSASVRRADGIISQDGASFAIQVPAPAACAALLIRGLVRSRRRG
jgi:hypothetical protein